MKGPTVRWAAKGRARRTEKPPRSRERGWMTSETMSLLSVTSGLTSLRVWPQHPDQVREILTASLALALLAGACSQRAPALAPSDVDAARTVAAPIRDAAADQPRDAQPDLPPDGAAGPRPRAHHAAAPHAQP